MNGRRALDDLREHRMQSLTARFGNAGKEGAGSYIAKQGVVMMRLMFALVGNCMRHEDWDGVVISDDQRCASAYPSGIRSLTDQNVKGPGV